jgi:hypothetical protein
MRAGAHRLAANVRSSMAAKRKSRKRRKQPRGDDPAPGPPPSTPDPAVLAAGYARARDKDEAARAALKPLRPGERPTAVTVGSLVIGLLALANAVALAFGYQSGEDALSGARPVVYTVLVTLVLALMAWGMWRARYWAVLGTQTLLALAILVASVGLLGATTLWAAFVLVVIIASAGTLFWFLIKAMARIQMPKRPSSEA